MCIMGEVLFLRTLQWPPSALSQVPIWSVPWSAHHRVSPGGEAEVGGHCATLHFSGTLRYEMIADSRGTDSPTMQSDEYRAILLFCICTFVRRKRDNISLSVQ